MTYTEYNGLHLIYSKDDDAWYFQEPFGNWKVSQHFPTDIEAKRAEAYGKLEWGD